MQRLAKMPVPRCVAYAIATAAGHVTFELAVPALPPADSRPVYQSAAANMQWAAAPVVELAEGSCFLEAVSASPASAAAPT